MRASNKIIHGLWIGDKLSALELLTLHSFVDQGHTFHLWIYEPLKNTLPAGVVCQDADTIISRDDIFRRKYGDKHKDFGKGSLALFSDLFRYKLLYEQGGWWVDMDVTCLQSFDIESAYFFRSHMNLPLIGNVMKCPRKSEVMLRTYEAVKQQCDAHSEDWLLSNAQLSAQVAAFDLQGHITDGLSNADDWLEVERLLYTSTTPHSDWWFIHWMNEEWRYRNMDKNGFYTRSYLGKMYRKYNLNAVSVKASAALRIRYYLKELYRYCQSVLSRN